MGHQRERIQVIVLSTGNSDKFVSSLEIGFQSFGVPISYHAIFGAVEDANWLINKL